MAAWQVAYAELKAVESDLPPEGLRDLAEAAWWTARPDDAFAAAEAAYSRFVASGHEMAAGRQAAALSREYGNRGQSAVSTAWHAKALRHLEGAEDSAEQALLLYLNAANSFDTGSWDVGRETVERAIAIAELHGDATLAARGRMLQGMLEIQVGEVDRGMALLGEAAASVSAGDVDAKTGGAIMCNTITTCWDMADFAGAAEWTDNARRWLDRNDVPAFPGICSVRRAEILTLSGDWTQAQVGLRLARDDLKRYEVVEYLGEIDYALGEISLRRGNLEEAVTYFRAADEQGREPQPGYALVSAARGERSDAIAALERAFSQPGQRMERSRVLLPLVDLRIEAGDLDGALRTVSELESLAVECGTDAMRAWTEMAKAACSAAAGSLSEAAKRLDEAARIWNALKVPYEIGSTRLRRAILRRELGDRAGAELDLDAARSIFESLGARPDLERLDRISGADDAPQSRSRAVLVTDIVGSTRLAEAMGDATWSKLLAWHDRALLDLINSHQGEATNRTGDGYLATFVDVSSAVACAVGIQRTLERQRAEHGFAPNVRIGVHAAPITDVDGSPAGAEVHRASRIGALAEADEILVSRQASDALGRSIVIANWRSEQVKGFDEPIEVGTLSWGTSISPTGRP
jgi:class 3 adenylate cyclase